MTISKSTEYTTRSGLPVRIYATDGGGHYPVHGAVFEDAQWSSRKWTKEGKLSTLIPGCGDDLIPKPRTVKVDCWLNVYQSGEVVAHTSESSAKWGHDSSVAACIHIVREVTEGEGLT